MFPESQIVTFPDFQILALKNSDYISKQLLSGVDWAAENCKITELFIRGIERPLVLDIGANLGTYTIKLAAALRNGGDVIAFEPQPMIYYHLCTNIVLNKLSNVRAMNQALGDHDGTISVPTSVGGANCNFGAVSLDPEINAKRGWAIERASDLHSDVLIQRLDSVALPRKVDFLKLDVEGYERLVLEGGQQTLENSNWPPMILEVWQEEHLASIGEELTGTLRKLGYELIMLPGGECIAQHPSHPVRVVANQTDQGFNLARER